MVKMSGEGLEKVSGETGGEGASENLGIAQKAPSEPTCSFENLRPWVVGSSVAG